MWGKKRHLKHLLRGAQFCLYVEYMRWKNLTPRDDLEELERMEAMDVLGETLNEISVEIGPYETGMLSRGA